MREAPVLALEALPPPVRDALQQLVLALLDTVRPAVMPAVVDFMRAVEGGRARPAPADAARYPRSATELRILEALEALAPMPASPAQVATLVQQPRAAVRTILQALATLGTVHHPGPGLYRHRQPGDDLQRSPPRGAREERRQRRLAALPAADAERPSTRFAAQIAAVCRPGEEEGGSARGAAHL